MSLNVSHFDELLSVFDQVFRNDPVSHPIINSFNPVKQSIHVVKICTRIKHKKNGPRVHGGQVALVLSLCESLLAA